MGSPNIGWSITSSSHLEQQRCWSKAALLIPAGSKAGVRGHALQRPPSSTSLRNTASVRRASRRELPCECAPALAATVRLGYGRLNVIPSGAVATLIVSTTWSLVVSMMDTVLAPVFATKRSLPSPLNERP